MPHLRRIVPYHPQYWVPEGFFFPNYQPWKYTLYQNVNVLFPPWDVVPSPYKIVSQPGVVTGRPWNILYHAEFVDSGTHYQFDLNVWTDKTTDPFLNWWALELTVDVMPWAIAYQSMRYPAYAHTPVHITSSSIDLRTGLPCDGPDGLFVEGSTYAEGGTPYPFGYGGGP